GLPLSVCVAYMLAGPVINVVVLTSTYAAFNPPDPRAYVFGGPWGVVLLRAGLSYVVACVTALVVEWQESKVGLGPLLHPNVLRGRKRTEPGEDRVEGPKSWGQRLNNITQTALGDFIDIMAFLILGAFLAAAGRFVLKGTNLADYVQAQPAIAILL